MHRSLMPAMASKVLSIVGRLSTRETSEENQRQRCWRSWLSLAIAPTNAHSPPGHHNSEGSPSKLLELVRPLALGAAAPFSLLAPCRLATF